MTDRLKKRMELLAELGLTYNEKYRNFYHATKGRIDVDIVEYGTDELFEKHLKKLKI